MTEKLNNYLKLRCRTCTNVLSIFPITMSDGFYCCGRCLPYENSCVDVENTLASYHFPCRQIGCTQKLMPVHMKPHEPNCCYRKFKCMITNCGISLLDIEFLAHYRNKHMHLINTSGILRKSDFHNRPYQLLNYSNAYFLIISAKSANSFIYRLLYLGSPSSSDKFVFNLELKNGRVCNAQVESYDDSANVMVNNKQGALVMDVLDNDLIYIFVTKTNSLSSLMDPMASVSKMLNCPVCKNRMSKPIYQCKNGHVICNRCTADTTNCPTCNSECNTIRNLIIEELANDLINCCCEETKCSQILNTEHKLECPFASYTCPFCGDVMDYYVALYAHIKSIHANKVHDNSFVSIKSNLKVNETVQYFLFWDCYLFKIVAGVADSTLKLSVHLVGPRGNPNDFVWNMVNDSVRVEWLSFRRLCAKGKDTVVDFNNPSTFIALSKELMFPFVVNNTFSYTIQVGPF